MAYNQALRTGSQANPVYLPERSRYFHDAKVVAIWYDATERRDASLLIQSRDIVLHLHLIENSRGGRKHKRFGELVEKLRTNADYKQYDFKIRANPPEELTGSWGESRVLDMLGDTENTICSYTRDTITDYDSGSIVFYAATRGAKRHTGSEVTVTIIKTLNTSLQQGIETALPSSR